MALLASCCASLSLSPRPVPWRHLVGFPLNSSPRAPWACSPSASPASHSASLPSPYLLRYFFTDSSPIRRSLRQAQSFSLKSQIRRNWPWSAQIRSHVRARRCLVRPRFHWFLSEGHCLPDFPYFPQIFFTDSSTRPSRAIVVVAF